MAIDVHEYLVSNARLPRMAVIFRLALAMAGFAFCLGLPELAVSQQPAETLPTATPAPGPITPPTPSPIPIPTSPTTTPEKADLPAQPDPDPSAVVQRPVEPSRTEPVDNNAVSAAQADDGARREHEVGTEFWPALFGYRLKVTDTLILAVLLCLFVATIGLYRATRALVRGARESSRHELRAYLSAQCSHPPDSTGALDYSAIQISIENTGKTPAHGVRVWMATKILREAATTEAHFSTVKLEGSTVLNPRQVLVRVLDSPGVKDDTDSEALRNESAFIYTWGEVVYDDAFGGKHLTRFRFQWASVDTIRWQWVPSESGNEAT